MGTETDDSVVDPDDRSASTSTGTGGISAEELATAFKQWYHVPVLGVLMLYMFWSRFQNYRVFQRDGDGFWLMAVDPWYHWRTTNWSVENYPFVMGFDPWTGFPDGNMTGQFGTLFDLMVATLAMLIGLGSPSESDVLLAVLVSVPALAALVVIPVYLIGCRLGNRVGGLAGVAILALSGGEFFVRSLAGNFQHHVAEVLFMSIALLALMVALRVGETERPIWELLEQRQWEPLRRPTIYSALAGIAIVLYLYVWPPGVVLLGILGIFFVIQLTADFVRGVSPDHLAYVGAVSMGVVALGTAIRIQEPGFSATGMDYLPPLFALTVGAGCVFMAALARQWEARTLDPARYPIAVGISVVGAFLLLLLVVPGFIETLVSSLSGRVVRFGYSPGGLTVQEAQPPADIVGSMYGQYGMAAFTAFVGMALLIFRPLVSRDHRAEHLLIVVWALVLFSMMTTQVRFHYYYILPVAVLNAHLVGVLVEWLHLPEETPDLRGFVGELEAYQVITVAVLVLVLFVPLMPPLAGTAVGVDQTPMDRGSNTFATGDDQPWFDAPKWEQANSWLNENTPEPGNYAGAGNDGALEYFGAFDRPSDGSFDYPDGYYGVLSWWDYGHLITVQGERIPHSNPFQQNVRSSSAFLTAQDEEVAELYLDAIAAGESPDHESDRDDLREAVDAADGDDPGIQYIMIDDDSAAGKFPAITQWTGPEYHDYLEDGQVAMEDQQVPAAIHGEYRNTMLSRLYLDDANGLEHYRLVHEIPTYTLVGLVGEFGEPLATPWSTGEWGDLETDASAQFEQARAQHAAIDPGIGVTVHDAHLVSALKTFERVDGATLTGQTEASSGTVTASLSLETGTNRTFVYSQQAAVEDGSFELTVPYPTDETLQPDDGYADSSVVMTDDFDGYDLVLEDGEGDVVEEATGVTVPEDDVQEGGEIQVTLEPSEE